MIEFVPLIDIYTLNIGALLDLKGLCQVYAILMQQFSHEIVLSVIDTEGQSIQIVGLDDDWILLNIILSW